MSPFPHERTGADSAANIQRMRLNITLKFDCILYIQRRHGDMS